MYFNDLPLSSTLHCFWWDHFCLCSPKCNASFFFFLSAFKIFSLNFLCVYPVWSHLASLNYEFIVLIKFRKFWPLFLQLFFLLSPLFFFDSNCMHIKLLDICSLFFSPFFFSLYFILNSFHCNAFKSAILFFWGMSNL